VHVMILKIFGIQVWSLGNVVYVDFFDLQP